MENLSYMTVWLKFPVFSFDIKKKNPQKKEAKTTNKTTHMINKHFQVC